MLCLCLQASCNSGASCGGVCMACNAETGHCEALNNAERCTSDDQTAGHCIEGMCKVRQGHMAGAYEEKVQASIGLHEVLCIPVPDSARTLLPCRQSATLPKTVPAPASSATPKRTIASPQTTPCGLPASAATCSAAGACEKPGLSLRQLRQRLDTREYSYVNNHCCFVHPAGWPFVGGHQFAYNLLLLSGATHCRKGFWVVQSTLLDLSGTSQLLFNDFTTPSFSIPLIRH